MKSSKGAEFERKISKQLSLWWSNGERDDIFWRSQQSGGRATIRRKKELTTANQEGDLTAMHPMGQPLIDLISIELKCGYPEFTIEGILNRTRLTKPILRLFIEQCEKEISKGRPYWWLIVRQHLRAEIILFDTPFRQWLRRENFSSWTELDRLSLKFEKWNLSCCRLEEFLNSLKTDRFREKLEEEK